MSDNAPHLRPAALGPPGNRRSTPEDGKSLTTGTYKLQEDGVRAGHGRVKITLL
jgi:hypothetical protein